jgi:hypothetical protein
MVAFRYRAERSPEPESWLGLDEQERIHQVLEYHRRVRSRSPNPRLHAIIHTIVETQISMGHEVPTGAVLTRLRTEGLERHDAVHAIGSVLTKHFQNLLAGAGSQADPNPQIWADLEKLTARTWRQEY